MHVQILIQRTSTAGGRAVVWEDSTCFRATKAHTLRLLRLRVSTTEACAFRACAMLLNKINHCNKKPIHHNKE